MPMSKFVHLHTHSHYSLLEALPKIPDLVKRAKKLGMESLALTDTGNLYGAIEFYKECLEAGIKPILGVDFYVATRTRHDKEAHIDNQRTQIILLAENEKGYKNLLKLVTASNLEGFYYKPRIDKELLEKYNEGLIAIAKEEKYYREIFKDRFYLEETLAIYNVHYLDTDDRSAFNTVLSIQGQHNRGAFDEEEDLSFRTPAQAKKDFSSEALEKTAEIAARCNLTLELGKWVFPNYVTKDKNYNEELRNLVYIGLKERHITQTPKIVERIEYELKIIKDKGYAPYFLVTADLLHYAHSHGILTNTRGSAAGSIVTYLTRITTIDPLKFELPFERFLNPDRPSPPDIDMDIADNRRDELIEYVRKKYGETHLAQIGTFGTMMARGVVRDVTRALGFPYVLGDQISKLIPLGAQGFPMTIERAFKESPEFKILYDKTPDVKTVVEMARKLEGNARHISVHAAGVVISPTALTDYTALQFDTKGDNKIITQYDMYSIEEAGLLKFDFLGIRNLSIIAETLARLEKIEGTTLTMEEIPIDDKKTFEMLTRGETEGTFQLNGSGMTKYLMDLKPTAIHDINVMVALYRPGPMDNIREYIARKHGQKPITYMHPKMGTFLKPTYGVLVYQDDLLMTAIEVAGYTWGEVDKFRKAVGKKIPEEMKKQHIMFVDGCQKHGGMSREKAETLWELFVPFQGYGFNKAHAASYGYIAYITAYLKANYPEIYMSAVLSAESGNVETIGVMVTECKRMGIEVMPPSVNESFSQFSVIPSLSGSTSKLRYKIRFGLTTIKNFGQGISSSITTERKNEGEFKSLVDFLDRIKDKNLNKKSLESLIKSGAFDELPSVNLGQPADRGILLANLDTLLGYHKEVMNANENQNSLFELMDNTSSAPALRLSSGQAASQKDKLSWEKELLGLYISGHPLDAYKDKFANKEISIKKLDEFKENVETVIGGTVEEIRIVTTKNNEQMAFVKLADFSGSIEVAIFPRIFSEFKLVVTSDACIAVKGKVSKRKGETSFIADKIKAL